MKRRVLLAIFLVLTAVALVGLFFLQSRKLAENKAKVTVLGNALDAKDAQLAEVQASEERLQREQQALLRRDQRQSTQANRQTSSGTALASGRNPPPRADEEPSEAGAGGFGKLLSRMMQDPDTKKFFHEQQRLMMDQLYGPLLKQLNLTPEETEKFKQLQAEIAIKGAENASSLLGATATNRTDMLSTLAADQQLQQDQIKELLGEARFKQYQDYQQTAGDRMQLNLFKQQIGSGEATLTEQQTEQLLTFIKEEKQSLAAAGQPVPGPGHDSASLDAMLSEDHTDTFLQTQESINERVYERAREVLSGDQLDAFAKFQTNQLQMMRMGIGMARKFFAPARSETPASPQP